MLVAPDLDGLDAPVSADGQRRGQEAQHDPPLGVRLRLAGGELAQQLEVLAGGEGALFAEPLLGDRVELQLGRVHHQLDALQVAQLAQLGAGEGGLGGAAAAQHHDLLDRAVAQRLQRVVGGVGAGELLGAEREHPRHVGGHVAVADDHRAPCPRGRGRGRGGRGGRCTSRRSPWPAGCRAGPRRGCPATCRSARRRRRRPRRSGASGRRGRCPCPPRRCRRSGSAGGAAPGGRTSRPGA